MTVALAAPAELDKLAEFLRIGPAGSLSIAVCDSMAQARSLIAALRRRLPLKFVEARLDGREATLFRWLDVHRLRRGDVLCLMHLERAPEVVFRGLDLQRELLAEHEVSAVCWVTRAVQRDLANRAPNFYAFRTLVLDFSESTEPDPSRYLQHLRDATATIELRGVHVGHRRALSFPLEDWYLPLQAAGDAATNTPQAAECGLRRRAARAGEGELAEQPRQVPLERLLSHRRLVVIGDPGSGKSTFLRWVAVTLCQTCLGRSPSAAQERLGLSDGLFPVLLRVADMDAYFCRPRQRGESSGADGDAAWLPDCLALLSDESGWGLEEEFFRSKLLHGECTVLLDGLDELPDRATCRDMLRRVERAAHCFSRCRFVMTSRPGAVAEEPRLAGFTYARVEPLSDTAAEGFLARWNEALYASPEAARERTRQLLAALTTRPEIRRICRNPVMLTALAIVHWNEKRLPEQRADLYESILTWLSRSREQRSARPAPKRCLELLQKLALEMHDHPGGRRVQVQRRWAAEKIEDAFRECDGREQRIAVAERFLAGEEMDSGIVVSRGKDDVRFWHLTFQEYLAARALAACPDEQSRARLLATAKLYWPEWREVFLLLAGVLYGHGIERLDRLFAAVLDQLPTETPLAVRACGAGLLGAAVRELAILDYRPADWRYPRLLDEVLAIFDPERCGGVPIRDAIAAADALGQAGDPRFAARDAEGLWVPIAAGAFWMGAQKSKRRGRNYDPEAYDLEGPVHRVQLPAYRLGRYPVTVDQYRQFVENAGYQAPAWWSVGGFGQFEKPEDWDHQLEHPSCPVVWVSWYEAQAYCRWAGCRLPSEAQWERAARGGDDRRYPWGSTAPDETRMNYGCLVGQPTPVGVYARGLSREGLADMSGNVWEWCQDWYAAYSAAESKDRAGPDRAKGRVIRGGSWYHQAGLCRVSFRTWVDPALRDCNIGFRTVRDDPASPGGRD